MGHFNLKLVKPGPRSVRAEIGTEELFWATNINSLKANDIYVIQTHMFLLCPWQATLAYILPFPEL